MSGFPNWTGINLISPALFLRPVSLDNASPDCRRKPTKPISLFDRIVGSAFWSADERMLFTCAARCDPCSLWCSIMTTILDDQLYLHSDRLAGKVVLITGGCCSSHVFLLQ